MFALNVVYPYNDTLFKPGQTPAETPNPEAGS
jgi:hypothetical protein